MKYADLRPKIKSGDLLAWSHREPWYRSWDDFKIAMVRMFTKSEYSHVGTAWIVGDRVFIIEAVTPLVRIYPLSKALPFYHLPLNAGWSSTTLEYALAKVGERYSQLQAIQAFFKLPKEDSFWECAELTRLIAKQDNINLGESAVPSDVVHNALRSGASMTLITE